MGHRIELFVPELEAAGSPGRQQLEEFEALCKVLPEMPAGALVSMILAATEGNTALAKRELRAWTSSVGMTPAKKSHAPVLWVLYENGWRYAGMPSDLEAVPLARILGSDCTDPRRRYAHHDEYVLLDFTDRWPNGDASWLAFAAFPTFCEPHQYASMYRSWKRGD